MPFPIRVDDVMSSPVRTASPDATAAEAVAECTEAGIGSLLVLDDGEPVGIVTNADFVRLLGTGAYPRTCVLSEFMSSPVITIERGAPVGDAVDAMYERGISRLVVLEGDEPVGLVSTNDVARYVPQALHRRLFASPSREHRYRVHEETAYEQPDWEFECVGISDAVDVGDRVRFAKTISEDDVRAFAEASGDTNRLHLDEAYAAETRFGRRIVRGTLVGGLISAALARLPGLTIYLSQDLSFVSPVDVGEWVTAVCEVAGALGRDKYELTIDVFGEDGQAVIEGQATVLIDEPPETARIEREPIA